jgi:hypothetical protein
MSLRTNTAGQVESVKTVPVEHVAVIESRDELVDALGQAQAAVAEISADLAEYDALVASQTTPAQPAAPAAPEAPQAPVAPADGGAQ